MAKAVVDRTWMTTATTGTGTMTLGSAVAGYMTLAESGVNNADTVSYVILDGNDFEVGTGTYTSAGTTLARTTVIKSKIAGTTGTTKINLSGAATVFVTSIGADIAGAIANSGTDFTPGGQILPITGTTTKAPIVFPSGTLNTTAQAGAQEFDTSVFYDSIAASTRAARVDVQYTILDAAYTLTSTTSAQKLFNASSNGAVTLPVGLYRFKCGFTLTAMSNSSNSFGFALAGSATYTQGWWANAAKISFTTGVSSSVTTYNTTANASLVPASTTTTAIAQIDGWLKVTVAGTVIPQVSLGGAAAAIVGVGSFFEIWALHKTSTNTTVGNWS